MDDPDYYAVLGLQRNSSAEDVKKAYRRLALRWHPDKNPNNKEEAERRFKLIAEAYDVLSDESRRRIYDQYGKAGLVNGVPHADNGYGGEFDYFSVFTPFQFHFRDPMDIFREVFGGSGFESLFGPSLFMGMDGSVAPGRTHRSASHRVANRQSGSPYHCASQATRCGHVHGHAQPSELAIPSEHFGGGIFDAFFGNSALDSFFGTPGFSNSVSSSSTSMFGSFGGGPGFRSVSTSSRTVNGKTVRVTKVVENGQETITEEIDGRVTTRTTRPHGSGALQAR
ncbi:unnamed protein product [Calicophoron daubneyi]|uniref:J domain-containing protein n=1 Tax=Calicophoron daubneyi TaxID=300641 RepID=A0AAV2TKS0_CALDB